MQVRLLPGGRCLSQIGVGLDCGSSDRGFDSLWAHVNNAKELLPEDLIPGKQYLITLQDCCIEGTAIDVFVRYDPGSEDLNTRETVYFEHVQLGTFYQVTFEEYEEA
jgi:hypothetical protein